MTPARGIARKRIALMLSASLCMVLLGFLHVHGHEASEQLSDSHFCFACSLASSVDVEADQALPQAVEALFTQTWQPEAADPCADPLIVFSARAPPSLPS